MALCSVKNSECRRNTGFLSHYTPLLYPLLASSSSVLAVSPVLCVFLYSYRCLNLTGTFSRDRAQAADFSHLQFASQGKTANRGARWGGVVHALRRTPVVWLQLLNQRRYRVMFKGRFKVTLSTGPARFLHIKHSYISVAGWIIDWTCYWTCYKMTPLRCGIDIFGASNKGFTPATRHLQLYGTLKLWLHDGLMGHFWKVMSNISRSVGIWRHFRKEEGASRCFVPEAPQRTAGIVAASICRLSEVMQTRLANETFNYISTSFLFEWEQLHGEGFLMNNLFWWIFSDHFSHIFLHWALRNFWHLTFFY